MEMKIILAAVLFLGGWLWSYFILRQLIFNFTVAYPLIRKMNELQEDLIAIGAKRYTNTSVVVCSILSLILLFLIIRFCPLYMIICFFVGALICLAMLLGKITPSNPDMFDSFCNGYYRFVLDDELRTEIYHKDIKKINKRLRAMGFEKSFIPEQKKPET